MAPPPHAQCSYAPVPPSDGLTQAIYDKSNPSGPSSRSKRVFGWKDALIVATSFALALVVAYQARSSGRGSIDTPKKPTMAKSSLFLGGNCTNSPTRDPNPNMTGPRVVWRMSFPNSGTSYTGKLIKNLSNTSSATNYGKEARIDDHGYSVPLRADSQGGPYLSHFVGRTPKYVITKTHCGGRCCFCGPNKYIETQTSFEMSCLQGSRVVPDGKGTKATKARYSSDLVQRAIHVVRDPFDNIVSRFHLERKGKTSINRTEWLEKYTANFDGFQAYCSMLNDRYVDEETDSRFLNSDVLEMFEGVPCHAEFYKYAQWHTLAVATRDRLRLPSHVLHYEDFGSDFNQTTNALLNFLELDRVGPAKPVFIGGKSYRHLYTDEQKVKAMRLIRKLASPAAWNLLKRYDYV